LAEIEQAIDAVEVETAYLTKYMADMQGRTRKKNGLRDYSGSNGRELAALDYLRENKTASARFVASKISSCSESSRRFPAKIRELFETISKDHGLLKAEELK
jgi:hypothetical protein